MSKTIITTVILSFACVAFVPQPAPAQDMAKLLEEVEKLRIELKRQIEKDYVVTYKVLASCLQKLVL